MSHGFEKLLVHLRRVSLPAANRITDAELLSRFVKFQDMVAFELLFWRHGPMVWGVCRRFLGNSPDAEDAFQATLLVLARKARSVGKGAALAGWLHRVARHTALNARKARARRMAREKPLLDHSERAGLDDPSRQAAENELKALIDQEIAQLPEKFRLPLILCDMEGRNHEAAAAELNCPLGTLNSRLARGRARLRERLLRRGVSPVALAGTPVPLGVASAALRAVSQVPSAPVLALAQSVMLSLTLSAAKKLVGALAVCCLLVAGIAGGIGVGTTGGPDEPNDSPAATPIKQVKADEKLNFIDPEAGPLPPDAVARIGSPRLRHADTVTGLAYSPNGKWLASISTAPDDNTARLWDAATGKEQLRVKVAVEGNMALGNENYVPRALGFAANSQQFLVVDAVSIRSFEIATGKELFAHPFAKEAPKIAKLKAPKFKGKFPNSSQLDGAGIAPDGKTFVLNWGGGLFEIRDIATGAVRKTGNLVANKTGSPVSYRVESGPFEFSHDGRSFAIGPEVFDTVSGQQIAQVQAKAKDTLQWIFAPDGEVLVRLVPGQDRLQKAVEFFEVKTGKLLRTIDVDTMTSVIAISPDGKLLVAGSVAKRYSQLIDTATGKEIGRIPSTPSLNHLAFSPDGKLLAGARSSGGAITVWDVASRRFHPTAAEPTGFYWTTFSSDGKALVLPGRGRPVVDWRTGQVIRRHADVEPDLVGFTRLSPDEKLYAVADKSGLIRLLDAQTGNEVRTLTGHTKQVGRSQFSGDGRRLASCGWDKVIRVWDVATGREIAQFAPPEVFGSDFLSLSDNGRILAASFDQQTPGNILYTWDVDAKVQLARIEAPQRFFASAELSPDGRFLAGGGGTANSKKFATEKTQTDVTIWNASSGKVIHSLPGHETTLSRPGAWCSFSPSSQLLVTSDGAGRLRLWETLSGKEVYRFDGHRTQVYAPFFSPDGRLLVAASEDAPCFIWDVIGSTRAPQPGEGVDLEQLWRDLADADAKKAFLAMRQFVARPGPAVELIGKNLKSTAGIDAAKIGKLLRDLDSPTFAVRESATAELIKNVDRIEPALTQARATATPEVRTRLDRILEKATVPSSERLRQSRALGALEFIATPAAAKLLADLAAGSQLDSLTVAAAEASERLRARGVK